MMLCKSPLKTLRGKLVTGKVLIEVSSQAEVYLSFKDKQMIIKVMTVTRTCQRSTFPPCNFIVHNRKM